MGWIKLDDGFFNHRKIVGLSKDAKMLYLAGLCYSGASLTDGLIPKAALHILGAQTGTRSTGRLATELVAAGLWIERGDDFEVHGYLEYNTRADVVRGKREAARERMQRNRSQNVRANKSRSSREVREPETEIETETETDPVVPTGEGGDASSGERASDPPPPPEPPESRGLVPLPVDFAVTPEMAKWAENHGISGEMTQYETEKFRDYWAAKGEQAVDWQAKWRTWIRRELDERTQWHPVQPLPPPRASPRKAAGLSRAELEAIAAGEREL